MKKLYGLSILFIAGSLLKATDTIATEQNASLVLFFDINGTIMAEDVAGGENFEHIVLRNLAGTISAQWQEGQPVMTYREMVDRACNHLKGKEDTQAREDMYHQLFAKVQEAAKFGHLSVHDFECFEAKYNNAMGRSAHHKQVKIFTSFVTLVNYLKEKQIPFKLIYRTFGDDYPLLEEEIAQRLPGFGVVVKGEFKGDKLLLNGKEYACFSDALEQIPLNSAAFMQDDYAYWNAHKRQAAYGKPMPCNLAAKVIFFDDNATRKQILKICTNDLKPCDNPSLKKLIEQGNVVPVDTYEALTDDNYFVDKVEKLRDKIADPSKNLPKPAFDIELGWDRPVPVRQ